MSRTCTRGRRGGIASGTVLIGLGVLFLLAQNGIVDGRQIWRFWPMALIIGGLVRVFRRNMDSFFTGAILIVVGFVLELSEFGYIHLNAAQFWPIVLITIGAFLLWKTLRPRPWLDGSGIKELSKMELFTIFGGGERRIGDREFEHAEVVTVFGGYKIDLRKAVMKGSQAVVEATAVFGGVEMIVPESWNVMVEGAAIFGGYSDETYHAEAQNLPQVTAPQLIVRGVALFGGVVIKN